MGCSAKLNECIAFLEEGQRLGTLLIPADLPLGHPSLPARGYFSARALFSLTCNGQPRPWRFLVLTPIKLSVVLTGIPFCCPIGQYEGKQ